MSPPRARSVLSSLEISLCGYWLCSFLLSALEFSCSTCSLFNRLGNSLSSETVVLLSLYCILTVFFACFALHFCRYSVIVVAQTTENGRGRSETGSSHEYSEKENKRRGRTHKKRGQDNGPKAVPQ